MIIFIFGGLLRKNKDGGYKTERFNYVRVLAGYYLYKKLSLKYKPSIIVSGGKGIYKNIPGVPPVAKVMKKELIQLGIPAKDILKEERTPSTYYELIWIKKYLAKNPTKIITISNGYHLARIKAMMDYLPELSGLSKKIILTSAEKVVMKYNKKLKNKIKKDLKNPKIKKIITNEKGGIIDLKTGNYKFRK